MALRVLIVCNRSQLQTLGKNTSHWKEGRRILEKIRNELARLTSECFVHAFWKYY
jgi:hypothetical protein